jgi:hypothetical protein
MKTSRCGIVAVCLTLLAACGSTTHPQEAEIKGALRRVQVELETLSRKVHPGEFVALDAPTPKGVGSSEWKIAVRKDRAIQRISAALSHGTFPQGK